MPGRVLWWINNLRVAHGFSAPMWCKMHGAMRYRSAKWISLGGIDMSFLNSNSLDELARRLADAVPESVRSFGRDLEGNFKAVLQAQLSKLDLVSRHEFDVQTALLARTQTALSMLEARVKELEVRLNLQ
jgi:hypothetical protein